MVTYVIFVADARASILDCSNTKVSDVSALASCKAMSGLDCRYTRP